ncbi:MAG TPA: hypothetical protein VMN58_03810 [Acidimicrobiales bacterium]|nr:hypothetical protein [Acidimicrobiales bacterium]
MCVSCVATGGAYVVPALAGLKLYGSRVRRRRTRVDPSPSPTVGVSAGRRG